MGEKRQGILTYFLLNFFVKVEFKLNAACLQPVEWVLYERPLRLFDKNVYSKLTKM